MTQVAMYCNSCGLAMSPFNAWQLLSGVETLSLRMEKQFDNALKIAQWLQQQPQVQAVYYTGLPDHPQAELIRKQQNGGGIVIGFEVADQEAAWKVVDAWRFSPVLPTSAMCARPSPIRGQPRTAGCSLKKNSPPISARA